MNSLVFNLFTAAEPHLNKFAVSQALEILGIIVIGIVMQILISLFMKSKKMKCILDKENILMIRLSFVSLNILLILAIGFIPNTEILMCTLITVCFNLVLAAIFINLSAFKINLLKKFKSLQQEIDKLKAQK